MGLYALVEAGDPEAIDVYLCEQDAQRALEDCLRMNRTGPGYCGLKAKIRQSLRPFLRTRLVDNQRVRVYKVDMRLFPGAVFAICFGAISHALMPGSIVLLLFSVGCGIAVGEMVFEDLE